MQSLSKLTLTLVLGLAVVGLTLPARAADLDKLAPADAEVAMVVNIKNFLDSKLFKKHGEEAVKMLLKREDVAKMVEATGLDPMKDLNSVVVTASGGQGDVKACVIIKGNYNVAKLQGAIEDHAKKQGEKLKITKEGGLTFYTIPTNQGADVTATFVGNDSLVLSNNADYLKLIANGKKIDPTTAAKTLKGAVGKVGGQETIFMAAAITDEMKKAMASNPQTKQFADKLDSVTGTVNVADAIDIALAINTTDADAAKNLGQIIKQAIPVLNLLAASNEQAAPVVKALVDNIKVSSEGKSINIKLQLTEELMKKLQPGG
jgi:hypothetical protein